MKNHVLKFCIIGVIAVSLLMVSGCAGYMEYLSRSSRPGINATSTVTRYESTDYDVLGIVSAKGESRCILGIIVEGTEGEALLWDAAKSQFGDRVTGVKDINKSYEYQSVLPPIFCEIKTTYVGTAVHER
ncbi:MAG: hypothetical protein U5L07_08120 [Desulfobacterales bacterium]|nr:hypothetical protein [Desulfobacterales bacterium]